MKYEIVSSGDVHQLLSMNREDFRFYKICMVCDGTFKTKEKMEKAYNGRIITHDIFRCVICRNEYGTGSYSSKRWYAI